MKIANNVEMLEIKTERGILFPVLTWDEKEVVLIDAGLPGQIDLIKEAVSKVGFSIDDITKVIITHQDMDHIGCAKIFSELGAEILAHKLEVPYVQGDKTFIRIEDLEKRLDTLSEGELSFYNRIKQGTSQIYFKVNRILDDEDELDFCGGIKVIHTPGHVPGHIALLLEQSNIIIAGDAANILNGDLIGANPQFTVDMDLANESLNKIIGKNPNYIVCYHGGLYKALQIK